MFPTTSLRQGITQQQTPMRQIGFGGHFKDAPPTYITDSESKKEDNKIERKEKPKCPKGHKVCRCKKKKKNKENKITPSAR